ncbi:MAG TPA: hypothetical protein VFK89_05635, partial [Actinomycetota bacterium]|nr:hypothetical protein [Actinomycetota bacterium]
SGTSYAVSLARDSITAREIAKDAVGASELARGAAGVVHEPSFAEDVRQDAVLLDGGAAQTAAQADYTIKNVHDKNWGAAQVSGNVELVNEADSKGAPAVVQLQVLEDGEPEGPAFTVTVADGETTTAPISIQCDAMPPGTYTISIEVTELSGVAEGVFLSDRVLDLVSFGPIFHPPR